jgi:hypothetical protein
MTTTLVRDLAAVQESLKSKTVNVHTAETIRDGKLALYTQFHVNTAHATVSTSENLNVAPKCGSKNI